MGTINRWIDSNAGCIFWLLTMVFLGLLVAAFWLMGVTMWVAQRAGAEPYAARATVTPVTPSPIPTAGPSPTPAPYPEPYPAPAAVPGFVFFAIGESQAQPAPLKLSGQWLDDRRLTLTWQGAPAGSCVYRVDRLGTRVWLPYDCGSAGIAQLGPGDTLYTPRLGDTYILRDELGGRDLVAIQPGRAFLPLVDKPAEVAPPTPSPTPIRVILPIVIDQ